MDRWGSSAVDENTAVAPHRPTRQFGQEVSDNAWNIKDQDGPATGQPLKQDKAVAAASLSVPFSELRRPLNCGVCESLIASSLALSCGHIFCGHCLFEYLNFKPSCPTCAVDLRSIPMRCLPLDSVIEACARFLPTSEANAFAVRLEEGKSAANKMNKMFWWLQPTPLPSTGLGGATLDAVPNHGRFLGGGAHNGYNNNCGGQNHNGNNSHTHNGHGQQYGNNQQHHNNDHAHGCMDNHAHAYNGNQRCDINTSTNGNGQHRDNNKQQAPLHYGTNNRPLPTNDHGTPPLPPQRFHNFTGPSHSQQYNASHGGNLQHHFAHPAAAQQPATTAFPYAPQPSAEFTKALLARMYEVFPPPSDAANFNPTSNGLANVLGPTGLANNLKNSLAPNPFMVAAAAVNPGGVHGSIARPPLHPNRLPPRPPPPPPARPAPQQFQHPAFALGMPPLQSLQQANGAQMPQQNITDATAPFAAAGLPNLAVFQHFREWQAGMAPLHQQQSDLGNMAASGPSGVSSTVSAPPPLQHPVRLPADVSPCGGAGEITPEMLQLFQHYRVDLS